jgi:hypothetical protein
MSAMKKSRRSPPYPPTGQGEEFRTLAHYTLRAIAVEKIWARNPLFWCWRAIISGGTQSDGVVAVLSSSDSDDLVKIGHEDFAITDFAGVGL